MTWTPIHLRILIGLSLWLILGSFFEYSSFASPRLITDNRVENLNGFPNIGRGYNLQSNLLQSMCFRKVVKTVPTFDLNYDVEEITQTFFTGIQEIGKKRLEKINSHFFVKKYFKNEEVETKKTYQLKNLLIRLKIRNYYYALDETQSRISSSAKQLLENEQYVTFFNSCGQHYVRSVGSFSTYLALLQYRLTGDDAVDKSFVNRLEKGLFNFSGGKKVEQKFSQDAEARGMRVFVQAIGLSKGDVVNLVPVDIDQFRQTVQNTVKLMQDPNSGLVSYMEVVPWVENPELSVFISDAIQGGGEQFVKLQRLEANAGIITEINRISNNQIEQYHIATMCKKILFENYMDKSNRQFFQNITGNKKEDSALLLLTDIINQKIRSYDLDATQFYNLAYIFNESVYLSLREFIQYFAKNSPEKLFIEHKKYLYGAGGAVDCIDKLYAGGLEILDYKKISSCTNALSYINEQSFFLDQYCLPKPVKLVFKDDNEDAEAQESEEFRLEEPEEEIINIDVDDETKPESLEDLMKQTN